MQDHSSRSDRLRLDLICGAGVAILAAFISGFVGMILMGPLAIALAWKTTLSIEISLIIAAGGLAVIPTLMTVCLLWRVARRYPSEDHVVRIALCGCAVGSFVGEAVVWFLLNGAILPLSP